MGKSNMCIDLLSSKMRISKVFLIIHFHVFLAKEAKKHQRTPEVNQGDWQAKNLRICNRNAATGVLHCQMVYQHLQMGAKWFLRGVNSPSLRV